MVRWVLWSLVWAGVVAGGCARGCVGQSALPDSDADGLSDATEQALLEQFLPSYRVSVGECDERPASFAEGLATATVLRRDGTIYGQATPRGTDAAGRPLVELHFYDLWGKDCGRRGHVLDAEHVSALLVKVDGAWTARYWFAAAHEATMCDISQVATGKALDAETRGPAVWLSAGKHAAYLVESLCNGGCGADRCVAGERLAVPRVVNLGEPGQPMHGAVWVADARWPMQRKLETDFSPEARARLEAGDLGVPVAMVQSRGGVRRTIYVANATYAQMSEGANGVAAGVSTAAGRTGDALGTADDRTEGALGRSAEATRGAVGTSVEATGAAVGTTVRKTGGAFGAAARWVRRGGRRQSAGEPAKPEPPHAQPESPQ